MSNTKLSIIDIHTGESLFPAHPNCAYPARAGRIFRVALICGAWEPVSTPLLPGMHAAGSRLVRAAR